MTQFKSIDPQAAVTPVENAVESIEERLARLPTRPGCYVFRDGKGRVLYVGKATSLKARVKSYYQESGDQRFFIPFLRESATDIQTYVTQSEKEAAILENSLIKELKPRFNVKLRDDKEFLRIRLDVSQPYPRLETTRKVSADHALYFGPYASASAMRKALHLTEKYFQIRTCTDREMATRRRPCLQYQIKRCPAPCVYEVEKEAYRDKVDSAALFLSGRFDKLQGQLKLSMKEAAAQFDYEKAAIYRDQLEAISKIRDKQRVVDLQDMDVDVLGLHRDAELVEIALLPIREGRVVDVLRFSRNKVRVSDEELVATFLREHYVDASAELPSEIFLPSLPEGSQGIEEWLGELGVARTRSNNKVKLSSPKRGKRAALLALANENAAHAFQEKQRESEGLSERLGQIQDLLNLPRRPERIECLDISHLGGEDTVGGLVAMTDGKLDKSRYRTFKLKSQTAGDDYAAIHEVLQRRFRRAQESDGSDTNSSDWTLPDLLVVDGGKGQLGVALAAAADLNLEGLTIVGLAKERDSKDGTHWVDRIFLPGQKNPVAIDSRNPELTILTKLRDEAHRFSNHGRKVQGKQRRFKSEWEAVPGLSAKTQLIFQKTIVRLESARDWDDQKILHIPGITPRHLKALRSWLESTE